MDHGGVLVALAPPDATWANVGDGWAKTGAQGLAKRCPRALSLAKSGHAAERPPRFLQPPQLQENLRQLLLGSKGFRIALLLRFGGIKPALMTTR